MCQHFLHLQRQGKRPKVHAKQKGFKNFFTLDSDESLTIYYYFLFSLPNGMDKRAHHNALERKRRDHIKDSFTGLRDAIPTMKGGDKSSRAQILKKASEYIQVHAYLFQCYLLREKLILYLSKVMMIFKQILLKWQKGIKIPI